MTHLGDKGSTSTRKEDRYQKGGEHGRPPPRVNRPCRKPFIMVVNGRLAHTPGLDSFQHRPPPKTMRFHKSRPRMITRLTVLLLNSFLIFSTSAIDPFRLPHLLARSFVYPYLLAFVTRSRLDLNTSIFIVEKRKYSKPVVLRCFHTLILLTASNTASPKLNVDQARRFQCCIVVVRPGRPACPTAKKPHPPFGGPRLGGADDLLAAVQHAGPAANWSATQP